jgi:hypothetical protein
VCVSVRICAYLFAYLCVSVGTTYVCASVCIYAYPFAYLCVSVCVSVRIRCVSGAYLCVSVRIRLRICAYPVRIRCVPVRICLRICAYPVRIRCVSVRIRRAFVYGTYTGSVKAFRARFLMTTTTTAIVAMSTVLNTRAGSHYRAYVTIFPLHLAISPRGSGERNTDVATHVRPVDGLSAISDVA